MIYVEGLTTHDKFHDWKHTQAMVLNSLWRDLSIDILQANIKIISILKIMCGSKVGSNSFVIIVRSKVGQKVFLEHFCHLKISGTIRNLGQKQK